MIVSILKPSDKINSVESFFTCSIAIKKKITILLNKAISRGAAYQHAS